jgi:hypothetical protein
MDEVDFKCQEIKNTNDEYIEKFKELLLSILDDRINEGMNSIKSKNEKSNSMMREFV